MLHVGLTGGVASGKSTVARLLEELGGVVVDADAIAHQVLAPGTDATAEVVADLGSELLGADGSLDRAALARVVFDDDAALARLTAIVHPRVRELTAAQVDQLPDEAVVVHDVPLIVENGMAAQYHLVVVVGASEAVRVDRAVQRGMTASDVLARMATQADDVARRRVADVWLDNEGSVTDLNRVVELIWRARIVPYRDNLAAGRAAEPGDAMPTDAVRAAWPEQAERLASRIDHVAAGALSTVRSVPPPDEPVLDVLELSARANGPVDDLDLAPAGFVPAGEGTWANADPGRPAVLRLDDPT